MVLIIINIGTVVIIKSCEVLDGIKLQPCSPTFVDSRNALIAADQALTGGKIIV
jgi:hypothetical protein